MPSHWRELVDPSRHCDHFQWYDPMPRSASRDRLIPQWAYFVRTAGFTLEFVSVEQIQQALEWFEPPIPRSSADGFYTNGHEHFERWFERLPPGLTRKAIRPKLLEALRGAIREFGPVKPHTPRGFTRSSVLRVIRMHEVFWRSHRAAVPRQNPVDEATVRNLMRYHEIDWDVAMRDLRPVPHR